MPVTYSSKSAASATQRYPPATAAPPTNTASGGPPGAKKKKKKKGKGKASEQHLPASSTTAPLEDGDGLEDEEDEHDHLQHQHQHQHHLHHLQHQQMLMENGDGVVGLGISMNGLGRGAHAHDDAAAAEHGLLPRGTAPLSNAHSHHLHPHHHPAHNGTNAAAAAAVAAATGGVRMSSNTASAQAELLAAANELYKRMETEQQMASDANDEEYWKQLPSHIRTFVETTNAHGAALSPNERSKSQAMLAIAQKMVDEATSKFPAGGFPPRFDPKLLSDPKFAEKLGMPQGAMNFMREYAEEVYDDYNSEVDEDDVDEEQQYEHDDLSKKKKKKKKKGVATAGTNGTAAQSNNNNPLPPIIPVPPNQAASITRGAPSIAQPRPSSRAAGKQPVYSQPTAPPARTGRSTATKAVPPTNAYNHGYPKSAVANGNSTLAKRPTGGGTAPGGSGGKDKLWSSSTEQDRERIKEFWLGLSDVERRDLVKLEKEAVLKKMKEQQKHSCSCAVCGRKRNAIEEELEVLYDAYYDELEQYANHQQQYQSSGGKITPPPGPGPFPGSVAIDKNGTFTVNGIRTRKQLPPPESEEEYEYDDEEDEEEYDDEEEEEEEEEEDDDDPNTRKVAARRNAAGRPPQSRRANGRDDLFNFGNLTTAGPGNILTVADDLLKNDGGKFLEMMEQLAERRMQREEDAAKEVEVDSDEEDDEDPEGSEEDDEDDEVDDDESEEEEEDPMSEEQKWEEGKKMFSIFAARMFEQRVLNAYREKVAAERQEQLLRELEDEDKIQAERDAKRQKENQKKKDKKKQQKQAKEAEKAKKEAEKAAEEAAQRAKAEALEEELKKKREEERLKREQERKQREEEKTRLAEERRLRIAEQKLIETEKKREKEERDRKERLARQEKETQAKAERAERERKLKEERSAREIKDREDRERREREDKERREKEKVEQAKAEERKRQEALNAAAAKARSSPAAPTSPRTPNHPSGSGSQPQQLAKKTSIGSNIKVNGPLPPVQRPITSPVNSRPQQPVVIGAQRPMMGVQGQAMPMMPFSPTMGMPLPPLGMPPQPFNPVVSPITMSPRVGGYGPPSATGVGHGPFSPLAAFAQGQAGPIIGNMQPFPFDVQSPMIPQPQAPSVMPMQPSRPPSTLPPSLIIPPKAPSTPTTNGIHHIGVSPGGSSAAAAAATAHMRRASAQVNPSPFGTIGKPKGSSSVVDEDDRMGPGSSGVLTMSPPSPDRPLGSSALVDENDVVVELPKRRGTAGQINPIGAPAAVGSLWGRAPTGAWPAPKAPGAVGMHWPPAPSRPQPPFSSS